MAGMLQKVAEASLSFIERITFEKDVGPDTDNGTNELLPSTSTRVQQPELDYPAPSPTAALPVSTVSSTVKGNVQDSRLTAPTISGGDDEKAPRAVEISISHSPQLSRGLPLPVLAELSPAEPVPNEPVPSQPTPKPSIQSTTAAGRGFSTLNPVLDPEAAELEPPAAVPIYVVQKQQPEGPEPAVVPPAVKMPFGVPAQPQPGGNFAAQRLKVSIIGMNALGWAAAQAIISQGWCRELALVDGAIESWQTHLMDLRHAAAFFRPVDIVAGLDYRVTSRSSVCILTIGAWRPAQPALSQVEEDVASLKGIIPQLLYHSPSTVLVLSGVNTDVLAWMATKISGLPWQRVLGMGTLLLSATLRQRVGAVLGASCRSMPPLVIGREGAASIPIWGLVGADGTIPPTSLRSGLATLDGEELSKLHEQVVRDVEMVDRLPAGGNRSAGHAIAALVGSIARDDREVYTVSVLARGLHDIKEDVFLSLPAIVGQAGVSGVVEVALSLEEEALLQSSAAALRTSINKLHL